MSIYDMRLNPFVPDEEPTLPPVRSNLPKPTETYKTTVILAAAVVWFWVIFGGLALGGLLAAWMTS